MNIWKLYGRNSQLSPQKTAVLGKLTATYIEENL
jgi:hypothetical protein